MKRFAFAIALVSVTTAPALAQMSAPCWVDWGDVPIDLTEAMCGGYSDIPGAATVGAAGGAAHTFPAWLIDSNPDNDQQARIVANDPQFGSDFVYGDRWVKNFAEWPYTFDAGNRAEWRYYDCATGWFGSLDSPFAGSSEQYFWAPGEIEVDVARTCQRLGVPVAF